MVDPVTMDTIVMAVAAALLLAAAAYAQSRIARYTAGGGAVAVARMVLIAVGVAFGYVAATRFVGGRPLDQILAFATGFGLVHAPAAIILFIKRLRAAGRS